RTGRPDRVPGLALDLEHHDPARRRSERRASAGPGDRGGAPRTRRALRGATRHPQDERRKLGLSTPTDAGSGSELGARDAPWGSGSGENSAPPGQARDWQARANGEVDVARQRREVTRLDRDAFRQWVEAGKPA